MKKKFFDKLNRIRAHITLYRSLIGGAKMPEGDEIPQETTQKDDSCIDGVLGYVPPEDLEPTPTYIPQVTINYPTPTLFPLGHLAEVLEPNFTQWSHSNDLTIDDLTRDTPTLTPPPTPTQMPPKDYTANPTPYMPTEPGHPGLFEPTITQTKQIIIPEETINELLKTNNHENDNHIYNKEKHRG